MLTVVEGSLKLFEFAFQGQNWRKWMLCRTRARKAATAEKASATSSFHREEGFALRRVFVRNFKTSKLFSADGWLKNQEGGLVCNWKNPTWVFKKEPLLQAERGQKVLLREGREAKDSFSLFPSAILQSHMGWRQAGKRTNNSLTPATRAQSREDGGEKKSKTREIYFENWAYCD